MSCLVDYKAAEGAFWAPSGKPLLRTLRTLLRTLFYCKTYSKAPFQNPAENPFPDPPQNLPRNLLRNLLRSVCCHTTPEARNPIPSDFCQGAGEFGEFCLLLICSSFCAASRRRAAPWQERDRKEMVHQQEYTNTRLVPGRHSLEMRCGQKRKPAS